jgi:UDP-N-acetylmuramoylalanine--D-glutamate ligase
VCQGEAGLRIFEFLERSGVGADVSVFLVPGLASAVEKARQFAHPGDVVLLSPGCASFDQYVGYAERGTAFAAFVAAEETSAHRAQPERGAVGR